MPYGFVGKEFTDWVERFLRGNGPATEKEIETALDELWEMEIGAILLDGAKKGLFTMMLVDGKLQWGNAIKDV